MPRRRYGKSEVIVREGDPGEEFFLIAEGAVDVRRRGPAGEERNVATQSGQLVRRVRADCGRAAQRNLCGGSERVEVLVLGKAEFRGAVKAARASRDRSRRYTFNANNRQALGVCRRDVRSGGRVPYCLFFGPLD